MAKASKRGTDNSAYRVGQYTPDCAMGRSFMCTPTDMEVGPGIQNKPIGASDDMKAAIRRRQRLQPMDKEIAD